MSVEVNAMMCRIKSLKNTSLRPPIAPALAAYHPSLAISIAKQLRSKCISSSDLGCHGLRPRNDGIKTSILKQQGFTLLEMVLVLFLMGILASATLFLTENVEDQAKYDETKRRIEIMRQAIVGNTYRTINGKPEVRGFAADMKRLPGCVKELLEQRNCENTADLADWTQGSTWGVFSGWRGPYIHVSPEAGGNLRFRDGYNNVDASDAENSGWSWLLIDASASETTDITAATTIKVSSHGADPNDASAAYPSSGPLTLVNQSDWLINTITLNVINTTSSAQPSVDSEILLRVYLSDTSTAEGGNTNSTTTHSISAGEIASGAQRSLVFTFDEDQNIPIGVHGYVAVCNTATYSEQAFTSDCSVSPSKDHIKPFTVVPRQTPTIDWIIE